MTSMSNHFHQSNRNESALSPGSVFGKSDRSIGDSARIQNSKTNAQMCSHSEIQRPTNPSSFKSDEKQRTTCFITGFSPEETQDELFEFLLNFSPHIQGISIPKKGSSVVSQYAFVNFDRNEHMDEFMRLGTITKDKR